MLEFLAPAWLWVPPLVAATGLWGLWRGQRVGRPVSSVRLWKGLAAGDPAARRRAVDPLWLVVLIAAVLAALGPARPQWALDRHSPALRLGIDVAVRDVALDSGQHTLAAWLKIHGAQGIPDSVTVSLATDSDTHLQSVSLAALKAGWTHTLASVSSSLAVEIRAGRDILYLQRWGRPVAAPFGVLELGSPDPMLRRAFEVHPAARFGDPTVRPAVIFIDQAAEPLPPPPTLEEMAGPGGLILAGPTTPFPGIDAGPAIRAPEEGWRLEREATARGVQEQLTSDNVRVFSLRPARFSAEWQILARAGGHPFMALSRGKTTRLWLAAQVTRDTDWWKHPSFLIFFAETLQHARTQASPPPPAQRIVAWVPDGPPQGSAIDPPAGARVVGLGPWIGTLAVALLVGAAAGLLWRGWRTTAASSRAL